jgi:hypothetical protein
MNMDLCVGVGHNLLMLGGIKLFFSVKMVRYFRIGFPDDFVPKGQYTKNGAVYIIRDDETGSDASSK